MRRRNDLLPSVSLLEGRLVLSQIMPAPSRGGVAARVAEGLASSGFPIGNGFLDPATWLAVHNSFVVTARLGRDNVVFLGDSRVNHFGGPGRLNLGTPVWMSQIAPLKAANFGIDGDFTENVLWRVQNGELAGHPKVAVVEVGVNNLTHGESVQQTATGILALVGAIEARSPRTKILLVGVLPAAWYPSSPLRIQVAEVNAILAAQSLGRNVRFLDVSNRFIQADGTIPTTLLRDGIHLTTAGYAVWADALAGPLRAWLGPAVTRRLLA
jgi:lysophospholipase L1-like esterase